MSLISFARGWPGPDLLPVDEFGDCAKAALARDGATALNYGPPLGYLPLREWLAERGHVVDRPRSPRGRNTSTSAIGANKVK